jgi:hypothetical protein
MKVFVQKVLNFLGYSINKINKMPFEVSSEQAADINFVSPFTLTSIERRFALIKAVEHVIKNNIQGDFVECGVWRGGSAMLIALTLIRLGVFNRKIWLYDTFEGMPAPTGFDKSGHGVDAKIIFNKEVKNYGAWCYSSLKEVQNNLSKTQYSYDNFQFVVGKVEETIPSQMPNQICLLRLDTDWYESTKHELKHLFPLLQKSGILIIDDYGDWQGARKAVDEFCEANASVFLNKIDHTGRLVIKV